MARNRNRTRNAAPAGVTEEQDEVQDTPTEAPAEGSPDTGESGQGEVPQAETQPTVQGPVEVERKTIKSVIVAGLRAGLGTKEIAAQVQAAFPNSAAARKSEKHIAWYRSKLRQEAKAVAAAVAAEREKVA